MRRFGRLAYFALSVLFVVFVIGQAFLAGLSLFRSGDTWALHGEVGHLAVVIPFLMLTLSFALRLGRRSYWYAGLLLLGTVLQTEVFAVVRGSLPLAAAFHPVLALLLFGGSGLVAAQAWSIAREPAAAGGRDLAECWPRADVPSTQGTAC